MEGLTISVADILWIAAALSTLTAAWKIIKNNPIAKHEKRFEKDEILPVCRMQKPLIRLCVSVCWL